MFGLSKTHKSIPFQPVNMYLAGGIHRSFLLFWCICVIFIVPLSVVTRYLEWTGLEVTFGGVSFFITVYLPMILCIPFAYWFGFWWAAIPAYFSSFLVAWVGGMPIEWIILFSFANPLTLLFHYLSLSVFTKQQRISSSTSVIGFVLTSFIATLAGSTGAFIWAWSNKVGFHDAIPVWQGWWIGGWIQAVLIVLPMLYLLSPFILKRIAPLMSADPNEGDANYRTMFVVALAFILILVAYVVITRHIGIQQLHPVKMHLPEAEQLLMVDNAITSLSYPLYILLAVMGALTLIIYRAILYWSETIREANKILSDKNEELEKLATTDSLTGLLNRRKIMETAHFEFERARRQKLSVSILMLDIDKFKRINDDYGHLVGDAVIRQVSARVLDAVRLVDFAGRYGGEEFLICLPGASHKETNLVANRILEKVQSEKVVYENNSLNITISIGLAVVTEADLNATQLIDAADKALLQAKAQGRNRVISR